jgi:alpha,alpha-trehalose phosphorylase
MYLPEDTARGIDAQDDSFLAKPEWPGLAQGNRGRPLLLDVHPMVLYRHQVSKQADLILAMAIAGDDVDSARMRRNFEYYERVTTHDSTLSWCAFAMVAARVGEMAKAYDYFVQTATVDVEDLHGNLGHGSHIAALAGSWMVVAYGFAGLKWRSGTLHFEPVLPPQWQGLNFRLGWQGRRIEVDIGTVATTYRLLDGRPLTLVHRGKTVHLKPGVDAVCGDSPQARNGT